MIHANSRRVEIRHILLSCRSIVTHSQYSRFQRILYQRYPKARVMQSKKILVACFSLLLVGLALPTYSIPRAHAFLATNGISVTVSGLSLTGYSDPTITGGSTVDLVAPGATVTVNVALFADNPTNAYQRNVTVGVKFDWMTAYQNASNAGPTNTLTMTANQEAAVSISVSVLSTTGTIPHTWTLLVGDGPQNKPIPSTCSGSIQGTGNACVILSGGFPVEIWSGDQISAAQAKFQAGKTIGYVSSAIGFGGSGATTTAASQLAQARTESDLGDQSWTNGDFSGAKTHYQNAVTDANAAASSLANLGGGSTNAGIVSTILSGAGIAMFGVGGLLAGIGGFFYLRRKPKA